ncbi:MAG TPA: hypothetical protein PKZ32_22845 [Candidatus Melainabacteria bacterium]|nr:hypothetical protein [Candidatus Melainabacteria bacterium]
MSETPEVTGTAQHAGSAAEPRKEPAPQMFVLAMSKFSQAFEASDFAECVNWLKQAESLTAGHPDAVSAHREAFARVITACAAQGINRALYTGNVLKQHRDLADIIAICAAKLTEKYPDDQAKQAMATVIVGYSSQLSNRLNRVMAVEHYVTSAEKLDGVLDNLFDILSFSVKLDSLSEDALPGICDRLALANTAASNADCSLTWFFSSKLSDWDKAELYCRRAAQWLKHNAESPGKVDPNFDECDASPVVAALEQAAEALKLRHYKRSKKMLKAAEEALAETVCV